MTQKEYHGNMSRAIEFPELERRLPYKSFEVQLKELESPQINELI